MNYVIILTMKNIGFYCITFSYLFIFYLFIFISTRNCHYIWTFSEFWLRIHLWYCEKKVIQNGVQHFSLIQLNKKPVGINLSPENTVIIWSWLIFYSIIFKNVIWNNFLPDLSRNNFLSAIYILKRIYIYVLTTKISNVLFIFNF